MMPPLRLLVLLALAACARADVLTLRSGTTVEGLATERPEAIEMRVDGGTLTYRRDVVASLKRAPWKPKPLPKAPPVAAPGAAPAPAPAPAPLGGARQEDADAKLRAWYAEQEARVRREQAARPKKPVVKFLEGGNPKCKSYEIYFGPSGKPPQ